MTLPTGTHLGPYEILSPLGAGGMGEVYRARDTRLDRKVAIKVLPTHLSDSPELKQRFEREAKAISQLTHPHICTLHDIGSENGVDFLVMELLEGQTLAERLEKGALPTDQVLKFGAEIGEALEVAHRHRIVHRDLKPGNIMLTKSGVKLLDFGLAKMAAAENFPSDSSSLPTEAAPSHPLTGKGTVMGTFQYMAPEQLEGKDADSRTDIFAFGCVLYEMATGRKAFTGASQASLMTAIMSKEPEPISALVPMSPPALDRLVKTCLAKDPDERWQSAHDLKSELQWIAGAGSEAGAPAVVSSPRKSRERIAWTAFVAALVAAILFAVGYFRKAPVPSPVLRFSISPPEKTILNSGGAPPAISPDGRTMVFGAKDSTGKSALWARSLEALEPKLLSGTEDALFPFWSPDSRFIGFFADGKLKKIEVAGGPAQPLCDADISWGGAWNADGDILYEAGGLYRVSQFGGTAVEVITPGRDKNALSFRWPHFLPDGRHFLYSAVSDNVAIQKRAGGIFIGSLDSKESRRVLADISNAVYSAPGYLLFVRESTLMALPFDDKVLKSTGEAFALDEHVEILGSQGRGVFSVSNNGVLAYRDAAPPFRQLAWFDRTGNEAGRIGAPAIFRSLSISPNAQRAVAQIFDPRTATLDLWNVDLERGFLTRLTSGPSSKSSPVWSPDGNRVAFRSNERESGRGDIYQISSDGSGKPEPLIQSEDIIYPDDWSGNGKYILLNRQSPKIGAKPEVWIYSFADRKAFPFLQSQFNVYGDGFSPDLKWIVYNSDETGRLETYVTSFPNPTIKRQVSTSGGFNSHFVHDGKEVIYSDLAGKLFSVEVKTTPSLSLRTPKLLFALPKVRTNFDVTPDGQRFLLGVATGEESNFPINVTLNWASDRRKR